MSTDLIIMLVKTLGPIFIPLVTTGLTWLVNKALGVFNPSVQAQVKTFLPGVAAAIGAGLSSASGGTVSDGLVAGLAGTGIHQLFMQPVKAARGASNAKPS